MRGVEPRSAEPSASASPSAAISELSAEGKLMAQTPSAYPESIFACRSRTPTGASRLATPDSDGAGTRRADGLLLGVNQAASAKLSSALVVGTGLMTGHPASPARFRRFNTQRRNLVTPSYSVVPTSLPAPLFPRKAAGPPTAEDVRCRQRNRRRARSISRSCSRFLMSARLSTVRLPRANPIWTFALPSLK